MPLLPRIPRFALVPLAGLLLAGAAPAHAQVRNVNYTARNSSLNSTNSSTLSGTMWNGGAGPQMNPDFAGRNLTMATYDRRMSTLNGQIAATSWKEAFQTGPQLPKTMSDAPAMMRPELAIESGRFADFNSATQKSALIQRPGAPDKYADAFTFNTGTPSSSFQRNVTRDLSMQDIGRFVFSSSNPTDPGLPVTRAGAGMVGDARVTGTTISTPALFEFGDGETSTSRVRTGAEAAPRVINSDGDRLMLPPRRTSLTPTPSSQSGSSESPGSLPRSSFATGGGMTGNQAQSAPRPAPKSNVISDRNPMPLPKSILNTTPEKRWTQPTARELD